MSTNFFFFIIWSFQPAKCFFLPSSSSDTLSLYRLPYCRFLHSLCVIGDCFLRNSLPGLVL